jgi:tetratricopeptide (TPR) repeat protein
MCSPARYHGARRFLDKCKPFAVMALLIGPAFASQGQDGEVVVVWPKDDQTPSATVTVQDLNHKVPPKARKEMEKAEKARLENRLDDAINLYERVIYIDPEYVAARNNLAILYLNGTDRTLGVEQLHEAIKTSPRNATLFRNLAIANTLVHQFADAEQAARMAVDLNRTSLEPRMLLGLILIQERKFTDEALRCFERSENQFPLAHLLAGRVLVGQGEVQKGKSEMQSYLASGDPDNRQLALHWLDWLDRNQQKLALASPR